MQCQWHSVLGTLGTRHMGNFGFTFIDARASGFKRVDREEMMKMKMEMRMKMKMIESSSSSSPSFAHLKW